MSHPFWTNLQRFFISAGSGPLVVKRPGGGTAVSASRSAAAAAAPPPPPPPPPQRGDAPAPRTPPPALAPVDRGPPPPAQPLRRSCRSPSCPGTSGGDWLLGLDEATELDNAQAVSDDVCRDSAWRRRRRRRHSDTNAVAVAAPAAAAAAAGQSHCYANWTGPVRRLQPGHLSERPGEIRLGLGGACTSCSRVCLLTA